MLLQERALGRGREIGAVSNSDDELEALVATFLRGHPEIAGCPDLVDAMWTGIALTNQRRDSRLRRTSYFALSAGGGSASVPAT
ncbi:MAG: hypothetical protein HY985_19605 [Magnetospirillum sp.]|nr:hypothetical protein [Magnetospirillum sp.]